MYEEFNSNNFMIGVDKSNRYGDNKDKPLITRTIWYGVVISIDDPFDGNRIKARIGTLDREIEDGSDLLYAFPMMHKTHTLLPKVGEAVAIMISDPSKPYSNRFWFGPINSQFQNILNDPQETALSLTNEAITGPDKPLQTIPNASKLYPVSKEAKANRTDLGRDNTAIEHRKNELKIGAGRHLTSKPQKLNENNPCFSRYRLSEDDKTSSVVHVADYHVFIAKNGDKISNTNTFTDDDLKNVIEKGNSMVKGEPMVEFLKLMRDYVVLIHNHRNNNLPPNAEADAAKALLDFNFDSIISKYHKIN